MFHVEQIRLPMVEGKRAAPRLFIVLRQHTLAHRYVSCLGSVCFAIRCDEHPGEKPNITTTRNGDQALWHGDAIEIELAPER